MGKKKVTIILVIIIVILVGILLVNSYAWYQQSLNGEKNINLQAGSGLDIIYNSNIDSKINLLNSSPLSDVEGITLSPYTFSIKNNSNIDTSYTIYLDYLTLDSGEVRIPDEYIKYTLSSDDTNTVSILNEADNYSNDGVVSKILKTGTIGARNTLNYSLRIWISSDAPNSVMENIFKARIRVENTQVVE